MDPETRWTFSGLKKGRPCKVDTPAFTRFSSHATVRESQTQPARGNCFHPRSPSQYKLNDLYTLAHIAGDDTDRRIAIAYLPDEQQSVVTMRFDTRKRLGFRVEQIDVVGRPLVTAYGKAYPTTYQKFTKGYHKFLGRFVGASEEELTQFAIVMEFVRRGRRAPMLAGVPEFPLGDRSPSRKRDY